MRKQSPKWSIPARVQKASQENGPGPGTYTPFQAFHKSPAYSIGHSKRQPIAKLSFESPGPGTHSVCRPLTRGSLFSKSTRKNFSKLSTPGPGSYSEIKSPCGPSFTLKPRLKNKRKSVLPGPGLYSPSKNWIWKKAPQWSMTRGSRTEIASSRNAPGPGAYRDSTTFTGPGWGFSRDKRGKRMIINTPGPGAYNCESL